MLLRVWILTCLWAIVSGAQAAPKVVVTIKPIYGLVAQVMEGVATPVLLLPNYASPHTFQLKPSQQQQLHQADLIVWVGPTLESFLVPSLNGLPHPQKKLTLIDNPKLKQLPYRTQRIWHFDDSDHHHHHHHGIDPHIWLDPDNAQQIVTVIADRLSQLDPEHQAQYQANAHQAQKSIEELHQQLSQYLQPVHTKPFLVYHDGYQYLENAFKLNCVGTILLNPQVPLSAYALREINQLITEQQITCLFKETEFNQTHIEKLLRGLPIRVATLDPLGAEITTDQHSYENIMRKMGQTLHHCLSEDRSSAPN